MATYSIMLNSQVLNCSQTWIKGKNFKECVVLHWQEVLQETLVLSDELVMQIAIGYHKEFLKLMFWVLEWMAKGWWLIQWPIYIILVVDKTKLSCLEAWCRGKEDRVGGKGAHGQSKVMGINYITVVKLGLNAKVCMNLHVTLLHMSEGNFRS